MQHASIQQEMLRKICFSTPIYILLIFRKILRAVYYKRNLSQPANELYILGFHFIASPSISYQETCKAFVNSLLSQYTSHGSVCGTTLRFKHLLPLTGCCVCFQITGRHSLCCFSSIHGQNHL